MNLRRLLPALGAALLATGSACTGKTQPWSAVCAAPQASSTASQGLVADDTAFAVAFYPPVVAAAGSTGNVIMSPYSVSATMTMVDVGAAGQTESQIESVLHLSASAAAMAPAYTSVACGVESGGSSNGNQLLIANSLWGQQGFSFLPGFESVLEEGYGAPLQQVDFEGNAGGAVSSINGWVSDETQGEIPTLLAPSDVDRATRLVIVNAVYFKGTWAQGFEASQTGPLPFTLADGSQVQVPTMSATIDLSSGTSSALAVAELPYRGGQLAMDFLMPTGPGGLAAFEAALTPAALSGALAMLGSPQSTSLFLPKFSFKTHLQLVPVLAGTGMTDVFDPKTADLSGMDGKTDLHVSTVVQEALVAVDEEGATAAAATAAVVGVTEVETRTPQPRVVRIDQPFVFLIRDTRSGAILFMGHVTDPSG